MDGRVLNCLHRADKSNKLTDRQEDIGTCLSMMCYAVQCLVVHVQCETLSPVSLLTSAVAYSLP